MSATCRVMVSAGFFQLSDFQRQNDMYDILELNSKVLAELREIANSIGVPCVKIMKKPDLIFMILNHQPVRIFTMKS